MSLEYRYVYKCQLVGYICMLKLFTATSKNKVVRKSGRKRDLRFNQSDME